MSSDWPETNPTRIKLIKRLLKEIEAVDLENMRLEEVGPILLAHSAIYIQSVILDLFEMPLEVRNELFAAYERQNALVHAVLKKDLDHQDRRKLEAERKKVLSDAGRRDGKESVKTRGQWTTFAYHAKNIDKKFWDEAVTAANDISIRKKIKKEIRKLNHANKDVSVVSQRYQPSAS